MRIIRVVFPFAFFVIRLLLVYYVLYCITVFYILLGRVLVFEMRWVWDAGENRASQALCISKRNKYTPESVVWLRVCHVSVVTHFALGTVLIFYQQQQQRYLFTVFGSRILRFLKKNNNYFPTTTIPTNYLPCAYVHPLGGPSRADTLK